MGRIKKRVGLCQGINCTFVIKLLRTSRSVCTREGHKDMGPIAGSYGHSTGGEAWSRLEAVGGRRLGCIQRRGGKNQSDMEPNRKTE